MANEETLYTSDSLQNDSMENQKVRKTPQGDGWKLITFGGITGVLMGAGAMYAANKYVKSLSSEDHANSSTDEGSLQVAKVQQDISFKEAFFAAREEVGPGGVFHWHGGIYNTYTAEEWNAMSDQQKHNFAQQVKPEIRPEELNTNAITDDLPDIATTKVRPIQQQDDSDVEVVGPSSTTSSDDDVQIVGYAEFNGHLAVGLDTVGDGHADIAIIDIDDSGSLTTPDVVVDNRGNVATIGEMATADPQEQENHANQTTMEDPEIPDDVSDPLSDMMVNV